MALSIPKSPLGRHCLSPLRSVSGTALSASTDLCVSHHLKRSFVFLSSLDIRTEAYNSHFAYPVRVRVHCESHNEPPLEHRTKEWLKTVIAGTSLTPPLVSHHPTVSSAPIKDREEQHRVDAGGPAWAPYTGLEKACILAHNILGVAFGLVLGHVLLDLDLLVSIPFGSGDVTVGTARDGSAGVIRGHAAAPTRTLQRGTVKELQVGA